MRDELASIKGLLWEKASVDEFGRFLDLMHRTKILSVAECRNILGIPQKETEYLCSTDVKSNKKSSQPVYDVYGNVEIPVYKDL